MKRKEKTKESEHTRKFHKAVLKIIKQAKKRRR